MNDWTIWQLADSAFPAGGFAHSGGLEAAWQAGEIRDASSLARFARDSITQAGRAALPFVTAAHIDPERIESLDALCDAFLSNAVANRASRAQGRAFLTACASTWPCAALHALAEHPSVLLDGGDPPPSRESLRRAAVALAEAGCTPPSSSLAETPPPRSARRLAGHLAPLFGAATREIGCPLRTVQRVFLHLTTRGVLSAAVRLGIVGPYAAQRLHAECASLLDRVLERCADLTELDVAQTAPLIDVRQGTHDRLYSRLFQS